jgi:hypothetical protein
MGEPVGHDLPTFGNVDSEKGRKNFPGGGTGVISVGQWRGGYTGDEPVHELIGPAI